MMDGENSDQKAALVADLWHLYDEHATQARQHETLRATATGTLAAIAAAVIALAGVGGLSRADIPAGLVVVIIGVLGVALNLKHFERNRWHAEVMRRTQQEIERLRQPHLRGAQLMSTLLEDAVQSHARKFVARSSTMLHPLRPREEPSSLLLRMRLYVLWVGLSAGIAIIGIVVIALAIIGVSIT